MYIAKEKGRPMQRRVCEAAPARHSAALGLSSSYSTAGLQDRVGASGAASDSEEENDDVFRTSETGPSLDPSKGLESQDEDQEEEEGEDGNEDDEEYVVSVGKRMKVKEVAMQAPGSRERKKPKLEGTSTQVRFEWLDIYVRVPADGDSIPCM
ncbi:BQ5605_C016g08154 [Microbotryum silenes-dioicae]|uniref:BQ5605_C016g08154 protein n=1 Tax=Microbotryum silenes-dioicae TaxID=796604 RepID=A0A2X0LZD4_9BASI|nr:BQ5605_C016g08154 [Microbotryum silenes-dioicae]